MNNSLSHSLLTLIPDKTSSELLQTLDSSDKNWLRQLENQLDLLLYISYLEARKGGKRKKKMMLPEKPNIRALNCRCARPCNTYGPPLSMTPDTRVTSRFLTCTGASSTAWRA